MNIPRLPGHLKSCAFDVRLLDLQCAEVKRAGGCGADRVSLRVKLQVVLNVHPSNEKDFAFEIPSNILRGI